MKPISKCTKLLRISNEPNALEERIKELNCLYGISNLLENQDVSLSWIMQRAVELIPTAWQYPEKACASINLDGMEFLSKNFKPTQWRQNVEIVLNGIHVGEVAVYYAEPLPEKNESPFLEEEYQLLNAIGERLSKVLWLKRSEEALKESEERYRVLTEQVTDGVALVQDSRFHYVNPEFCRLFCIISAEDIHDRKVSCLPLKQGDEIASLYEIRSESVALLEIKKIQQYVRSEKTLWIQACHNPITYKGRPALLSTFRDITEIKEQQIAAQKIADMLNNENRVLRSSLKERYRLGNIIGRSMAMQEVYEIILKAAATNASVVIYGESGSGKELVAHAIHDHSPRKNKRFVAVNCGAIQESLFEREFFGHRKGSFSSAHTDAPGYLDIADGGTLFLDEVSELTPTMQTKLLRAIEGGGYRPVGGTEPNLTDFRIICASNIELNENIRSGQMRSDFFYRIQVIQIKIPPLRRRKQDIPLLVEYFMRKITGDSGTKRVPGNIMDILIEYDWPGNVRELYNVLQRYVTLGTLEFLTTNRTIPASPLISDLDLRTAIQKLEKSYIEKALHISGGNRSRAANLLGVSRRALFRKLSAR